MLPPILRGFRSSRSLLHSWCCWPPPRPCTFHVRILIRKTVTLTPMFGPTPMSWGKLTPVSGGMVSTADCKAPTGFSACRSRLALNRSHDIFVLQSGGTSCIPLSKRVVAKLGDGLPMLPFPLSLILPVRIHDFTNLRPLPHSRSNMRGAFANFSSGDGTSWGCIPIGVENTSSGSCHN